MAGEYLSHTELDPEQQMMFDKDIRDLKIIAEEHQIKGLEGRVKFGLDPAAMLAVRDLAPLSAQIAKMEGTAIAEVWPLIKKLHEEGPWESADQLKAAKDGQIRTYLILAAACKEKAYPGYDPKSYLEDRGRIIKELTSFTPDQFATRKAELISRAIIEKVEAEGEVPVAEGDVALPLSVQGYRGCVAKAGEMRFAQTTNIADQSLEESGLKKGFAEVYNPEKQGFERISLDDPRAAKGRVVWVDSTQHEKNIAAMEPIAKRIAPGYVLTYKNEDLAVELVSKAIKNR